MWQKEKNWRNWHENFPTDVVGCSQSRWHYVLSNKRASLLKGELYMGLLIISMKCLYPGSLVHGSVPSSCDYLSLPLCLSPLTSEGIEEGGKTPPLFIIWEHRSLQMLALLFPPPTEAHTSFSWTSTVFQDVSVGFLHGETALLFLNGMSLGIFSLKNKKKKYPKT